MSDYVASYITDIGYTFQLVSLSVIRLASSPETAFDEDSILPASYLSLVRQSEFSCSLCGISPRKVEVKVSSGHIIDIDMPLPFSSSEAQQVLEDLKSNNSVLTVKTKGERISFFVYRELVWR